MIHYDTIKPSWLLGCMEKQLSHHKLHLNLPHFAGEKKIFMAKPPFAHQGRGILPPQRWFRPEENASGKPGSTPSAWSCHGAVMVETELPGVGSQSYCFQYTETDNWMYGSMDIDVEPIYRSIYRSIDLSIYRPIDLSIYRSIYLSFYFLSIFISIYLSFFLSSVSVYLDFLKYISIYLSI